MYVVVLWFCYIFLFFKQKTAYEMRSSDWSSDVCSSDLIGRFPRDQRADRLHLGAAKRGQVARAACRHAGRSRMTVSRRTMLKGGQIGRASCRERVCQDV